MKKVIGYITTKKSKEVKGTKDVYVCNDKGAKCIATGIKYIGHFEGIPANGYIIENSTLYINTELMYIDPVHSIAFNEKELSRDKKELFTAKVEEASCVKKSTIEDFFKDVSKSLQERASKELKQEPVKEPTKEQVAKELEDKINTIFGQGSVKVTTMTKEEFEAAAGGTQEVTTDEVKNVIEVNYEDAALAYTRKDWQNANLMQIMMGRGDFTEFSNELTRITGNKFYASMGNLFSKLK